MSFSSYILWAVFIVVASIFVIHFIRDLKAPAQGDEMYQALTRLEEKSSIM